MLREKLLIVEDEKIIALDLQKRLEKFDYQVVGLATTGKQAVELVEEFSPDIILMDIMLSGDMDGIEAAKIIGRRYHIPVIFLTAYADERTLERAKEAEPFGYILKPFKEKELNTTIDIALYKHKIDRKLKMQERWSSAILHSIGDGIIATNCDRNITFMNPVAEIITGWTEEDAVGHPLYEVLPVHAEKTREPFTFPDINSDQNAAQTAIKDSFLMNREGVAIPVEGSISIIRDRDNRIDGQVIALRDITEKRQLSDTINYQASHDALTGLVNRTAFSFTLTELIESTQEDMEQHALLYLDLDQFKLVNDTAGHEAGDQLLLETTKIIKSVIRGSDICARLGGDEFGILLRDSNSEQAKTIARRLHIRLAETKMEWGNQGYTINSSIGLVMIDTENDDIHTVLAAADDACSLAKDEGGRRIKVYEYSNTLFLKRRGEMEWVSKLTKALEENRFVLFAQKIVPLLESTNSSEKYEILIRMIDEEENIISPSQFIPAAEKYNLMPRIDRWVLGHTLERYKSISYRNCGKETRFLFSINLSSQSITDETFLDFIHQSFKEHNVDPEWICFEITETAAISNMSTAGRFIQNLKDLGCTFALDDFGSGFSSFNYLKNMPIDFLKIDGSFIKDMDENSVNSAMVEAMNTLGHIMGVRTIAEFVRNKEIKEKCEALGVDYAQGYELAVPIPLLDIINIRMETA